MQLAYASFLNEGQIEIKLCLIPEKPDSISVPVPIDMLEPTDTSLYFIGPQESVIVTQTSDGVGKIIEAYLPAVIYMTPNSHVRPGTKVNKIKVIPQGAGHKVLYLKESTETWEPWIASRAR